MTIAEANDSSAAINKDLSPFFLNDENLNYSPIQKEMSAKAMSARKSVPWIMPFGMRSRKYGPISIPVIMYAVTFGSPISFVGKDLLFCCE